MTERIQNGQVFAAVIGTVSASGATLVLPGMEDETQKSYKALAGVTVTAGDMAICAKISGTYVILGLLAPDE